MRSVLQELSPCDRVATAIAIEIYEFENRCGSMEPIQRILNGMRMRDQERMANAAMRRKSKSTRGKKRKRVTAKSKSRKKRKKRS